ncbi:MAG: 3-deoxy-D-manno-octulosonic acid transferase [Hellea sp.]|nr:3-deoxy-D-manno-octulosonic acid transferase [Hellea sp.]
MTDTPLIKGYGAATRALGPLTPILLKRRQKKGKEDPARISERHGETNIARPVGPLYWLHGASVGECLMLQPVIERLLQARPKASILITSGTVTSAEILAKRLPERCIHQYVPLDYPKAIDKFLIHWRPDMAIWAESEIWPNMIRQTKSRNIPTALLNARFSEKSLERWSKRKKTAKALIGSFDLILAADETTAKGLSWLIDRPVEAAGNLKDAAAELPYDAAELKRLRTQTGRRLVWCAASTHAGEDQFIIDAHSEILAKHKSGLLILAPRHPERSSDIQKRLKSAGLKYAARSKGEAIDRDLQVYLFDTIGEMGLAYRLSALTFVCGSLLKSLSGHNPLEPARLDNAVLTGPHIASFADSYMSMIAFDAAQRVLSPNIIGATIAKIFADKDRLKQMQRTAKTFATGRDAVLVYVWERLEPLLPEPVS